ncbi:MAG: tRNA uridine-5-carboxymethylaminomethyl(34) synthesis GTPase MnmE [Clostridiaceae bacterium]|jgi:tRNA modification GTPase|nr:tRNA uridine-5-carboxymethylaminomethyl(34) synthesis GTPase MnmE [Clostridiaceae bacterium]
MNSDQDTIAAFSTPPGESGIAVMRLSGPDAAAICDRLFIPSSNMFPKPSRMKGYTLAPGIWAGIDDVVLSCFRAPHSYTGEDVFEISCHGGKAVREGILSSALASGARAAGPGEYSRRAFLNGKLDLAAAEAVMDLIEAQAEKQAKAAYRQLKGDLSNAVRVRADQLYAVLAHLEMLLDWDEEEEREEDRITLTSDLKEAESALRHLASTFRSGRVVREGLHVVIAGNPNVGKSSLLNALSGRARAIVSDIPGTTRDTVDIDLTLDGYLLHLTDTAGFACETEDPIELEGIVRAGDALNDADVVLWVLSPPLPERHARYHQEERIDALVTQGIPVLLILGKDDLRSTLSYDDDPVCYAAERFPDLPTLAWSYKDPEALTKLKEKLVTFIEKGFLSTDADRSEGGISEKDRDCDGVASAIDNAEERDLRQEASSGYSTGSEVLITHERHKAAVDRAANLAQQAIRDLERGLSFDLVAITVREAITELSLITGDDVSETLVEMIFNRFCIGK